MWIRKTDKGIEFKFEGGADSIQLPDDELWHSVTFDGDNNYYIDGAITRRADHER